MLTKPRWKETQNRRVTEKGYRLWRNKDSGVWVLTKSDTTNPPEDSHTGGYYNLVELLKTKGI